LIYYLTDSLDKMVLFIMACPLKRDVNHKKVAVRNKLVQKFSPEEMEINSDLLNEFCFAFSSANIGAILELLHNHGRFFNNLSKGKAAGVFHKMIHGTKGIKSKNSFKYNRGISLDIFPGQEVLEIRCYDENLDDSSCFDFERFLGPSFGEPIVHSKNEIIFRFVFRYYEHKIFDVKMTNNAVANPERIVSNN